MSLRLTSRAVLCQVLAGSVIAITLAGCGGVTTAAEPADSGTGCPPIADIDSLAAVGKACGSQGKFCDDPSCNPCNPVCHAVECDNGVWKQTPNRGGCADSGSPPSCGSISGAAFDQSCQSDQDCVAVTVGNVCGCMCASDAINVKDESRYNAELHALLASRPPSNPPDADPTPCFCPAFGRPVCIAGHCRLCGGEDPACPDGG